MWVAALLVLLASHPAAAEQTPQCVACRADEEAARADLNPAEWKALRDGRVVTLNASAQEGGERRAASARAAGIVPYPPEQVWSVLTDFEEWPGFMPLVKETRVTRQEGTLRWVRQRFRVLRSELRHTTRYELDPARGVLRWSLDRSAPHDLAASEGAWQLVPLAGGKETLVRYGAEMDAGRAVPGFVESFLLRRSLPDLIERVRSEVDRRARADAPPSVAAPPPE